MAGITHKTSRNALIIRKCRNYQIRTKGRLFNNKKKSSSSINNDKNNTTNNDNIKTLTLPMILTRITFLKSLTYQFPLSSIS